MHYLFLALVPVTAVIAQLSGIPMPENPLLYVIVAAFIWTERQMVRHSDAVRELRREMTKRRTAMQRLTDVLEKLLNQPIHYEPSN